MLVAVALVMRSSCSRSAASLDTVIRGHCRNEHIMKITRIRPWHVSGPAADPEPSSARLTYVFVQVETDEGLTGWGEITTYPGTIANRTIVAALRELDGFVRGADPTAILSGLDIALWDIKAQSLGVPIYELLGGPVRETIPLYTHFQYAPTVEQM